MFGLLSSRQEIIERISFLSGCGHRFILLSGDKGVGKSTIIEYLLESYFEEFVRKYVSVSPNINDIQVRSLLLEAVFPDVAFDPEISLVKSFATHSTGEEEKFLVIDNGQNISEQVSAELLQLSLDPERFHLTVLFASQSDSSNVKLLTEHSSVVSVNVDCLDLDESKQFLDYHFEELADEDLVTEFILKTGGHPQRLQQWEQRESILGAAASDDTPVESTPVNWRIPAIIALALIGALTVQGYLYYQDSNEPQKIVVSQPKPKIASNDKTLTEQNNTQTTDSFSTIEASDQLASNWGDTERQAASADDELAQSANTDLVEIPEEHTSITTADTSKLSESQTESDTTEISDVQEENVTNADQILAAEKDIEVTQVEATVVTDEVASATITEPSNEQKVADQPEEAALQNTTINGINIKTLSWFAQLPASSYFLQASGVSSIDTLEQFLRFENIIDQTVVYKTIRNEKPWFVVLFGPYENADLARNAISDLPESIQKLDPWAKSLTAIKQELPATPSTQ